MREGTTTIPAPDAPFEKSVACDGTPVSSDRLWQGS
jgi:hypothetical protein